MIAYGHARGGRAPCVAERRRGTAAGPLRSVRRRHGRGQAFRTDLRGRRRVRWCRSRRDHDLLLRVAARTRHVSYRLVAGGEERPVDVPPNVRLDPEVPFSAARWARWRRPASWRFRSSTTPTPGRRRRCCRPWRSGNPSSLPGRARDIAEGYGLRDGETCRLMPPGDPQALERAVVDLLADPGGRGARPAGPRARRGEPLPGSATPRRSARSCAASRVVSRLRSAARRRAPRGRR